MDNVHPTIAAALSAVAPPADPLRDSIKRTTEIAMQGARLELALRVNTWAIRHAMELPTEALKELTQILTEDA